MLYGEDQRRGSADWKGTGLYFMWEQETNQNNNNNKKNHAFGQKNKMGMRLGTSEVKFVCVCVHVRGWVCVNFITV